MTLLAIIVGLVSIIILTAYIINRNSATQDWDDDYVYNLGKTVENDKISN